MSRHAPVRHTCPDIDKCIKYLKSAQQNIDWARSALNGIEDELCADKVSYIKSALEDALKDIDFAGMLEELRDSNSALRNWVHELVVELERLEKEI